MYPINAQICKANEERELQVIIQGEGRIRRRIVQLAVPAYFEKKERGGENGHDWHRDHSLFDFQSHLIGEILGVGESGVIEDELVGKRCAKEIDHQAEKPASNDQNAIL